MKEDGLGLILSVMMLSYRARRWFLRKIRLKLSPVKCWAKSPPPAKYVALNPTAKDGSEKAAAISYDNVDVATADKLGTATVRQSAVKASELIWPAGITDAQKAKAITELEAATIILR